jgi:cytochrome c551/c552
MGGSPAPAAPAAAAKPAAAAPAASGAAAPSADMTARIAALKAKMEAGKGASGGAAPAASTKPAAKPTAKPAAKPAAKGAPGKTIWPVQPIDRTSFGHDRLYRPATLNRWFMLTGLALAVMVVWMIQHDYDRDWKDFQSEAAGFKLSQAQAALAVADADIDMDALKSLQADLTSAEERIAAQSERLSGLEARKAELEGEFSGIDQLAKFAKSEFDAARYGFEELRLSHGGDAAALEESERHLAGLLADMKTKQAEADKTGQELDGVKAEIDALTADRTEIAKQIDAMTEARVLLAKRVDTLEPGIFNTLRNAPIADMLVPTLKIDQIVLEKLKDNYNFMYVGKIDRCTTCHVGIDDAAFAGEEWDQPGKRVYMRHPRPDLFVSDDSPHPKNEFGCTVCHQGRGQAVEFPRTFHVPTGDEFETEKAKLARWETDYGYDKHRHYWDWPMVPTDKLYSSCFQCHQETDRIQGVPEYNDSRELVETLGCYGCHKIEGFEHLRKAGPDLSRLAAKTTESWTRKWVMEPKGFRPTTRMPHFWDQSNTGKQMGGDIPWNNNSDRFVKDWRARNQVEARAVAAYVYDKSNERMAEQPRELAKPPAGAGDAENGQAMFEVRGCLGCHSLERAGQAAADHGPELSKLGSKVNARWLYDWLREPRNHFPTTIMPDLRLTEQEAWDITAYLMQGRDPEWEGLPEPKADESLLREIAVEYLAPLSSEAMARSQVEEMRAEGGDEAIEHYVGGKLFARYGCSGCHLVPGHEEDKGIGTELTKEGLKELSKFDFGFEHSPHNPKAMPYTRHDWFRAKLRDPRVFDRMPVVEADAEGDHGDEGGDHGGHGRIVRYDQKVKAPGDKLKMPNFNLTDDEIELLTQFLMGLRDDGIDPTMKRSLSGQEQVLEQASRLMTERNCMGCHKIGQLSAPLAGGVEEEDNFYQGYWMAQPVEVGGTQVLARNDWLSDEIYNPAEEEDWDTFEFFEENPPDRPLMVLGQGEGAIAEFIEQPAMQPPVLRGEGAKVQPQWLYEFLLNPYIVRTHVEVRMPTFHFSPDQSEAFTRWFAAQDGEPWPFSPDPDPTPQEDLLDQGVALFEKNQCNSCHPAGGVNPSNPDPSNWGPDLALTAARLKTTWVSDWLKDPQALQPGTKMPTFFGERVDGEYNAFVDDWKEQIRGMQHYLRHMEAAESNDAVSMGTQ